MTTRKQRLKRYRKNRRRLQRMLRNNNVVAMVNPVIANLRKQRRIASMQPGGAAHSGLMRRRRLRGANGRFI